MDNISIAVLMLCIGFAFGYAIRTITENKVLLNSNFKCVEEDRFAPEFSVESIEAAYDAKHRTIAKYTISNCFFAKKGNKDFRYNTFYFYDKTNKYKVGDSLKLELC